MAKIWTILKALWTFIWTNRDLIEKHIEWIKAEKAAKDAATTSAAEAEKSTDAGDTKSK